MLTTLYPRAHACLPSLCCPCASHSAATLLPLEIYRQRYEAQCIAAQCTFFVLQLRVSLRLPPVCETTLSSLGRCVSWRRCSGTCLGLTASVAESRSSARGSSRGC